MSKLKTVLSGIIFFVAACASSMVLAKTQPGYDWAVRGSDSVWRNECSSCHMGYLPKMLSADNWRRIMQGLDKHFGSNASLAAPQREEITAFLVFHAAPDSDERYKSDTLRITETPWFLKGHGPNAGRYWVKGKVGRAANCTACHRGADYR